MHTFRQHLEGENILDPVFRYLEFGEEDTPQRTVICLLRHAWGVLPPKPDEELTLQDVHQFVSSVSRSPTQEWRITEPSVDKESIETVWRKLVYDVWKHVFVDASNFFDEVSGTVGHYHANTPEYLPIYYGDDIINMWDSNILIMPAWQDEGTVIQMMPLMGEKEEPVEIEQAKFLSGEQFQQWFIRRDVKAKISVKTSDDAETKERKGLAAVLVIGPLCLRDRPLDEAEDEEGTDGGDSNEEEEENEEVETEHLDSGDKETMQEDGNKKDDETKQVSEEPNKQSSDANPKS